MIAPGSTVRRVVTLCGGGLPSAVTDLTAVALINGRATVVSVTVTEPEPGRYLASFVAPATGWLDDDVVHLRFDGLHEGDPMRPATVEVGVIGTAALDPADIASAVWDASAEDYALPGSMGEHVLHHLITFCKWVGLR